MTPIRGAACVTDRHIPPVLDFGLTNRIDPNRFIPDKIYRCWQNCKTFFKIFLGPAQADG